MNLDKLAPILGLAWEPVKEVPSQIQGFWNEDATPYYLDVPDQIRDIIVYMQNQLHKVYMVREKFKLKLSQIEDWGLLYEE
jgi:hypothetical protein